MRKTFLLALLLTMLFSCKSITSYNEAVTKLHSVEDLQDDVDKLYKQLKKFHPRLYQYIPKEHLDFKFDSLKKSITKPMTSRAFHKELAQVTKFVGQGHMSISPPSIRYKRKERKARLMSKFDINNLDFEYLDHRIIVREARGNDSLLLNAELLEVNGNNAINLHNEYKKIVASDGYNTTFHDRVVGYRFLKYYQQANGHFDSITLKLRNQDSTFLKTYKRVFRGKEALKKDSIKGDSIAQIKSKNTLTKAERKAKKKAKKLAWKRKRENYRKYGYDFFKKTYFKSLNFIGEDSTIAVLKIKSFSKGRKYKDFYEEVFTKIDSAKSQHLIIDLRNNFGGRLNEILTFYSYLTDENYTLINKSETNTRLPILKSAMSNSTSVTTKLLIGLFSPVVVTYDLLRTSKKDGQLYYKYKAAKEQEPNPLNFKGKIYVLINGNSFSASSVLSTQLKGTNRAIFVGEETGGAYNGTVAGQYKSYVLPNTKIKARIGLMHIDAKPKITPDGYGVKPDVEILPTYQDRLNNKDPELEWVLRAIKQNN
jgi:C-terminal processing protease CtpA/Prc